MYNKEKNKTPSERLAIGLSGGIDSFVAACLLKIQKVDLIALTTQSHNFDPKESKRFFCYQSKERFEAVEAFCDKMSIPLYVIKNNQEFDDSVKDVVYNDRLLGMHSTPCLNCHHLKIKMLVDKTKELGINSLALGYYAKIFKNLKSSLTYVHSSNDKENDQSSLLCSLPKSYLRMITLPLADLQKKEVMNLSKNFGLDDLKNHCGFFKCLPRNDVTTDEIKELIAPSLYSEGRIYYEKDSKEFKKHNGVIEYEIGQVLEEARTKDAHDIIFTKYSFKDKSMYVNTKDQFHSNVFQIQSSDHNELEKINEPFKGHIRFEMGDLIEATFYPKMFATLYVKTDEQLSLIPHKFVSVYRKSGRNSKAILTGKITKVCDQSAFHRIPRTENENETSIDWDKSF